MGRGLPPLVAPSSREISWWIVALNLGGSVAFQVSAIAAFVRPATDSMANASLSNLGTFIGAVGFFVGALLLIPEMRRPSPRPVS